MAPPIYFFPKITKAQLVVDGRLSPLALANRDLGPAFADVQNVQDDVYLEEMITVGPGDTSGCLLMALPASGERPVRVGYCPDFQEWAHFGDAGGAVPGDFWFGVDKEHPITSADLARKSRFDGYSLTLAGQEWIVPVIRDPEGGTGLPRDWLLMAGGEVTEEVQAAYLDLWRDFVGVVDLFYDPEDPGPAGLFQLDRGEAMRRCLEVLAVNYRFGRAEQNTLRLVNPDNWLTILSAAVDLPTFRAVHEAAQEKKRRQNSPPASATESQDT